MQTSRNLLLFIIASLLFSCDKDNDKITRNVTACGINNPIMNMSWLNSEYLQIKSQPNLNAIVLYQYEGMDVIEIQNATASSTNQHQYFCNGTKFNLNDPLVFNQYKQGRKEIAILFGTKIW